MLPHVMGYSFSVPPKPASKENLPPICVDSFNSVDVGKKETSQIPAVPAVKVLHDKDRFELVAAGDTDWSQTEATSSSESGNATARSTPTVSTQDIFAIWDRYKDACSGGGLRGRQGEGAKLLQTARMMTVR
jgi:hypothetical protein